MLGGKADGVTAEQVNRPNEIIVSGNRGREDAGELREGDRDGGNRSCLDNQKERPAEKKSERWPVGFAEENVNAASPRHHRGQLGTAKRARHCHHARDGPGEEQPAGSAREPRRFGRGNEDAGADHRTDHDHGGIDRAQTPNELSFALCGRFHQEAELQW